MSQISKDHIVKTGVYELQGQSKQSTQNDSYDGIPIYATTGLHAHVFSLIKPRLHPGSKVLELGAGGGALSKRLFDNGYKITSSDLVEGNFRLADTIPFKTADLNLEFSQTFNEQFDAVVATELVEHIENVRNFYRQCKQMLKPGGYLVMTTPNTENALSLAYQMRFGHHLWFSNQDYEEAGHINPITSWHFKAMAREANLAVDYLGSFGDIMRRVKGWPKMKLLTYIIRFFSKGRLQQGEILICICKMPT